MYIAADTRTSIVNYWLERHQTSASNSEMHLTTFDFFFSLFSTQKLIIRLDSLLGPFSLNTETYH